MLLYAYSMLLYACIMLLYASITLLYHCVLLLHAVCWYSAAAVCVFFMLLYASFADVCSYSLLYCCMLVLCRSLLGLCCFMLAYNYVDMIYACRCFIMHTPFGQCDTHKGTAEFVFCQHTPPSACVGCRAVVLMPL